VNPYVRVELKRHEEQRILSGHPWVYANEVAKTHSKLSPGSRVEVVSAKGRVIGRGLASPASKILVRLLAWDAVTEIDEAFIASRVRKAVQARQPMRELYATTGLRLIFGEADGLPGLIVDAFEEKAVLSCFSAGMNPFLPVIVETLVDLGFPVIYERSAGDSRQKEGLAERQGFLRGEATFPWKFKEGKASFHSHPSMGQKTGFYLDFRIAREKLSRLSAGKKILDAFCYQGSASIQAALGGAGSVLGLDSSDSALEAARENARLNGVSDRLTFRKADCFHGMKALKEEGASFDGMVLDPPPLVKSVHDLEAGKEAFRRLTEQALGLLNPGGFMVVSSCSHHFNWNALEEALTAACREAGRRFILSERLSQPQDHPVLLGVPETEYLRALVLREA